MWRKFPEKSETKEDVRPSIHFKKKSLLEPQPTPRPFRAPYGRTSAASPAKEHLAGPELPPADEIRKSKKVALTENIVQGEEEHLGDPRQCV